MEFYVCGDRLLEAGKRTKDSIYVYMGFTKINALILWYIIKPVAQGKRISHDSTAYY